MRALIEEAVQSGARKGAACECVGLSIRRLERWATFEEDQRSVIEKIPVNRLSDDERRELLNVVNRVEYRDLSPKQIVPRLADKGEYLASESTIYRILKSEGQLEHRGRSPMWPLTVNQQS
jgi:IS30 family transposase